MEIFLQIDLWVYPFIRDLRVGNMLIRISTKIAKKYFYLVLNKRQIEVNDKKKMYSNLPITNLELRILWRKMNSILCFT